MRGKWCLIMIWLAGTLFLAGCSFGKVNSEKVRDLEYTLVAPEDAPEEVQKIIDEKKKQEFQFSYAAGEELYIVIGYGEQETGGYSIVMDELYLGESAVVVGTTLKGPSKEEPIDKIPSYPFIIIKTENVELPVEYLGVKNNF